MLKEREPSSRWYRKGTGDALVELVAAALSSDAQALSQHAQARQALVEIAAALAAMNIPRVLSRIEAKAARLNALAASYRAAVDAAAHALLVTERDELQARVTIGPHIDAIARISREDAVHI